MPVSAKALASLTLPPLAVTVGATLLTVTSNWMLALSFAEQVADTGEHPSEPVSDVYTVGEIVVVVYVARAHSPFTVLRS